MVAAFGARRAGGEPGLGADRFILSSDLGQSGNPIHPDGYKKMVAGLKADGVSQADIDEMMKTNPAKLLGLD